MTQTISDNGVTFSDTSAAPQQFSISAAVAANALTFTLQPSTISFRSTTLATGGVTTLQNASALTLTVPASATLGTINATQARLALIALNNAGTIELAVANLAGGIQLDETNLINTTAISGTSTAANVIYSASARTSVPYRVVGFIDITEATAGTWATAPSTIQGVGGQALASLSSLGYGQTWQDVGASRALGTTYTNSTGKPITLSVVCSASSSTVQLFLNINGGGAKMLASGVWGLNLCAVIPPGATYAVTTNGPGSLNQWMELR